MVVMTRPNPFLLFCYFVLLEKQQQTIFHILLQSTMFTMSVTVPFNYIQCFYGVHEMSVQLHTSTFVALCAS